MDRAEFEREIRDYGLNDFDRDEVAYRIASAIDAVVDEFVDLLDEYGGSVTLPDGTMTHDGADARRALRQIALRQLGIEVQS